MNNKELDSYIRRNIERVDGMLWCNRAKYISNASFSLSNAEESGLIKSYSMTGTIDKNSVITHITIIGNDDSTLNRHYLISKDDFSQYCVLTYGDIELK
jgi:hypothetical protein